MIDRRRSPRRPFFHCPSPLRPVTTHFEVDVIQRLEEIARERHISKSDVIREMLRRGLLHHDVEQARHRIADEQRQVAS